MAVAPIKPSEIVTVKSTILPDGVMEAFNELIAQKFSGNYAQVYQKDVVSLILQKIPGAKRDDIFTNDWLEIEDIYRAAGWEVEYDKPGYTESYSPSFKFRLKR